MQKFDTFTGIAAPLPEADLDTDIIFPARFLLLLDKAGIGKHVFHERRHAKVPGSPEFILNVPPFDHASILVAGANFGSGSSREQAVWALLDFGIRCVIAPSFGEIFHGNCFKNGMLPVVLGDADHARVMRAAETGRPLTVSLEELTIRLPDGNRLGFEVDPYRRSTLLLGLDEIGAILAADSGALDAFEAAQRLRSPWLYIDDERRDVFADLSLNPEAEDAGDE